MKKLTKHVLVALSAMLPVGGYGEEATPASPVLWEAHARLSGGKNPKIADWMKQIFRDKGVQADLIGEKATVSLMGFENPKTPQQDWLVEVRDLPNAPQLLTEIQKRGQQDGKGHVIIKAEDAEFSVWSPTEGVLRVVFPSVNAERKVPEMARLTGDVWLTGSIDLSKIEPKEMESTVLKFMSGLNFTFSSQGQGAIFQAEIRLANPKASEEVAALIKEIHAEATEGEGEKGIGIGKLPLTLESKGDALVIKAELDDAKLDALLHDVKVGLKVEAKPSGEDSEGEPKGVSEF